MRRVQPRSPPRRLSVADLLDNHKVHSQEFVRRPPLCQPHHLPAAHQCRTRSRHLLDERGGVPERALPPRSCTGSTEPPTTTSTTKSSTSPRPSPSSPSSTRPTSPRQPSPSQACRATAWRAFLATLDGRCALPDRGGLFLVVSPRLSASESEQFTNSRARPARYARTGRLSPREPRRIRPRAVWLRGRRGDGRGAGSGLGWCRVGWFELVP
jgi:hypothetical protein